MLVHPFPRYIEARELEPGELYFLDISKPSIVCIRAVDPEKNGEPYNLPLSAPADVKIGAGELFKYDQLKVLTFGTDYRLLLPTAPDGWSTTPPTESVAMVMHDGQPYARGYFNEFRVFPVLVNLSNGQIRDLPRGVSLMYALNWEIMLVRPDGTESTVFRAGA
jgi:hypothetical protein